MTPDDLSRKNRLWAAGLSLVFLGGVIVWTTLAGDPANSLHSSAQAWSFAEGFAMISTHPCDILIMTGSQAWVNYIAAMDRAMTFRRGTYWHCYWREIGKHSLDVYHARQDDRLAELGFVAFHQRHAPDHSARQR